MNNYVAMKPSMKRQRGYKTSISMKSFYVHCGVCIAAIQKTSCVDAFAPIKESKKREGPLCPRRLTSASALPAGRSSKGTLSLSINRSNDETDAGESFAMRMASHQNDVFDPKDDNELKNLVDAEHMNSDAVVVQRRKFLEGFFKASVAGVMVSNMSPANAYEKAFPVNLDFDNNDSSINLQSIREERISVQKAKAKQSKSDLIKQPLAFKDKKDVIGSAVWGGALWFLLGSRSNPLVRPIANALYDTNTNKGAWVKDRNEGLFAPFPAAFSILMGVAFLVLGVLLDRTLLFVAEEDSNVVLQLAGVSLIGGASLELGRIASGEKMKTRADKERDDNLAREFEEFTSKKLIYAKGGSVHRSEVINSFRRYFAKYRVDNDEYPLGDLEIEQLLRAWNKTTGNPETMSGSGFLKNVKINSDAEIRM